MATEKGTDGAFEFKLYQEEINRVRDVIDKQVKKSCKDGLKIMEKDLRVEKFCFLCTLEQWGGMAAAKRNLGPEIVEEDLNNRIKTFFYHFKLESGIKNEKEQEKNQLKYFFHLEAVKKGIISLIFENKHKRRNFF